MIQQENEVELFVFLSFRFLGLSSLQMVLLFTNDFPGLEMLMKLSL